MVFYIIGMRRFPDSLGASAKKVNDAMHRFKKCASDTSWHLYRDQCWASYSKNVIYYSLLVTPFKRNIVTLLITFCQQ